MELINDLLSDPTKIIFILFVLICALFSAFIWARKELNASKAEVQEAVREKDHAKRAQADLAAKLIEAEINARYPH